MTYPAPTPAELADLRRCAEAQRFADTAGRCREDYQADQRHAEVTLTLLDAYQTVYHPDYYQKLCLRTVNVERAREALCIPIEASSFAREKLTLLLCSNGIGGEAGEVIEPIKKHLFHGKPLDREALSKEIGDVLWYLAVLAHEIGKPLSQVMADNVAKLEARHPAKATQP